MLFRPTNIYPDSLGGLGNGVVDINSASGLTVQWNVNGNSPMVAFTITIYANNEASTQLYTTGKLTSGCPFYGTDYKGEQVPFSYTISKSALATAGLSNGNEYKLVIKQYWTTNDFVTQTSASLFITRAVPVVEIQSIPSPLSYRDHTFNATYTQAQGDSLNWVRWQLAYEWDENNLIYDSQNIFSTAQLMMYYDGLFTGNNYMIKCSIETENGIQADSGWVSFTVSYESASLPAVSTATRVGGDSTAVKVAWNGFSYITPDDDAEYTINNGILSLDSGEINWHIVNGSPMSFSPPWTILYQGKITQETMDNGTYTDLLAAGGFKVRYNSTARTVSVLKGTTTLVTADTNVVKFDAWITVRIAPAAVTIVVKSPYGGLEPSESLKPSNGLAPRSATGTMTWHKTVAITGTQPSITSVVLYAPHECNFVEITESEVSEDDIIAIANGYMTPDAFGSSVFYTDFQNGLNAGSLFIEGTEIIGWAVYRKTAGEKLIKHLIDVGISTQEIYDYGCGSKQGPYTYYIYPIGEDTYVTDAITSNEISPCFWNWSVIECVENDDKYTAVAEYAFGKNLESSEISNNNEPNVLKNFTRYPTIQLSQSNFMSGSLSSLIGGIYTDENGQVVYKDTLSLRDKIYDLSTTTNALFLKSRKGDVIKIRVSAETSMSTDDLSPGQNQTVSLSWVQVGDAKDLSITNIVPPNMY